MSRRTAAWRPPIRPADFESKAKTEFLNRMSHDVRTPINGIMGMLDIIRSHRDDEARVDDCLQKIQLSASHLQALVNDVLDMSKLKSKETTLEKVPFELTALLKEAAGPCGRPADPRPASPTPAINRSAVTPI